MTPRITSKYVLSFVFIIAIGTLSLNSCQKVIDIKLNEADQRFVIEGNIYQAADSIEVRVTKTTSFFSSNGPETINNAIVKITMPDATVVTLNPIGNGYYKVNNLTITNNSNYLLEVAVDGKIFTSSTYMPVEVPLDSLEFEFSPAIFGGEEGYSVFLHFEDAIGENFYRARAWKNGNYLNEPGEIQMFDDNLNDGNHIRIPLFVALFDAGDSVEIELQSMSATSYTFYQTFAMAASEDAGSPFNAAPANPESNIVGGALGVFAAVASSRAIIEIPD